MDIAKVGRPGHCAGISIAKVDCPGHCTGIAIAKVDCPGHCAGISIAKVAPGAYIPVFSFFIPEKKSLFCNRNPCAASMLVIAIVKAIRILVSGVTALAFFYFFPGPEAYWLILITLLTILVPNQPTSLWLKQKYLLFFYPVGMILSIGILITINLIVVAHLTNIFLLAAYLSLMSFLIVYSFQGQRNYFAFVILITALIAALNPPSSLGDRLIYVPMGIIIAILVNVALWPPSAIRVFNESYRDFLNNLNRLQKRIFIMYLQRDYLDNLLYYEKSLHSLQETIFMNLQTMQACAVVKEKIKLLSQVQNLFEVVISLSNLRYRVRDHATFEVCIKEMAALSFDTSLCLRGLAFSQFKYVGKRRPDVKLALKKLNKAIQGFDAIYRSTLEVVTNNPVVFLIFIQNLKTIKKLINDLNKWQNNYV